MTGTNRVSGRQARRGRRRGSGSRRRTLFWRAGLWSTALCVGLPLALIVLLRWAPPPTTAFMLRSAWLSGTAVKASAEVERLAPPTYRWTDWEEIAPQAALAVIASEDQKFADHNGFDVEAIQMALEDAREGGRLRGASTISQQTAKNLFLWPGRSFVRKGLEAYLTVLIELCWSKQRIVEVYLNIAEFGGGLFGITAASERFFGKTPAELTADEAAHAAARRRRPGRGTRLGSVAAVSGNVSGAASHQIG